MFKIDVNICNKNKNINLYINIIEIPTEPSRNRIYY